MRETVKQALNGEHAIYEISPEPEDSYDTILGALQGVIAYNGLKDAITTVKHSIELELSLHHNYWDRNNVGRPSSTKGNEQFEVIWMLLVQMFGDYGTSPRWGWINLDRLEDALEFVNLLLRRV